MSAPTQSIRSFHQGPTRFHPFKAWGLLQARGESDLIRSGWGLPCLTSRHHVKQPARDVTAETTSAVKVSMDEGDVHHSG